MAMNNRDRVLAVTDKLAHLINLEAHNAQAGQMKIYKIDASYNQVFPDNDRMANERVLAIFNKAMLKNDYFAFDPKEDEPVIYSYETYAHFGIEYPGMAQPRSFRLPMSKRINVQTDLDEPRVRLYTSDIKKLKQDFHTIVESAVRLAEILDRSPDGPSTRSAG
jgi:hypothetical protein